MNYANPTEEEQRMMIMGLAGMAGSEDLSMSNTPQTSRTHHQHIMGHDSTCDDMDSPRGGKRRKNQLTLQQKKEIIENFGNTDNTLTQGEIAARYNANRATIAKIFHQRDSILQALDENPSLLSRKRIQGGQYEQLEHLLYRWILSQRSVGMGPVTGEAIMNKAHDYRQRLIDMATCNTTFINKLRKFKASTGWLDNFKMRFRISVKRNGSDDIRPLDQDELKDISCLMPFDESEAMRELLVKEGALNADGSAIVHQAGIDQYRYVSPAGISNSSSLNSVLSGMSRSSSNMSQIGTPVVGFGMPISLPPTLGHNSASPIQPILKKRTAEISVSDGVKALEVSLLFLEQQYFTEEALKFMRQVIKAAKELKNTGTPNNSSPTAPFETPEINQVQENLQPTDATN